MRLRHARTPVDGQPIENTFVAVEDRTGETRFFVSDRPDGFTCVAEMFLGRKVEDTVSRVPMAVLTEQEGAL